MADAENKRAAALEKYFKDNDLNFFQIDRSDDEAKTVVFRSAVDAEGQRLPMGIIVDNSVYTIIRVQVGTGLVKKENAERFISYLNKLNRSYKVFKYVSNDDGDVYLDSCIPAAEDHFDPEMIRIILNVIVEHLQETYKELMKEVWA